MAKKEDYLVTSLDIKIYKTLLNNKELSQKEISKKINVSEIKK